MRHQQDAMHLEMVNSGNTMEQPIMLPLENELKLQDISLIKKASKLQEMRMMSNFST